MTKMASLKRSAADRDVEKQALGEPARGPLQNPEDEGITVHLDHHHLKNMGVGGGLKSGHKVDLHAAGHVEHSETRSTKDGERHSARLRLTRMGVEHEGGKDEKRADLRNEIEAVHSKSGKDRDADAETIRGKK